MVARTASLFTALRILTCQVHDGLAYNADQLRAKYAMSALQVTGAHVAQSSSCSARHRVRQ